MRGDLYTRYIVGVIGALFFSVITFIIIKQIAFWRLPFDRVQIPSLLYHEKIEIPPRPGIKGIVISGPEIKPAVFEIDLSQAGVIPLDWNRLNSVDPHADIKVKCTLNKQGRLTFSRNDILMEGHTEAGVMIQNALRTWIYKPYKMGIIKFWFNLPSKGKKLIIDTGGLYRRGELPQYVPLYDGLIYYIEGITIDELQIK